MKVFSITWYEKLRKLDYIVLFSAVALTFVSLITLAGSVNDYGTRIFNVQLVATALGIGAMTVISTIDYEEFTNRFAPFVFAASVFVLALTLVIGEDNGSGNRNWIEIPGFPVSIQPSEFVKAMYIITFSKHLHMLKDKINQPKSLLKLGVHAGTIIGLVLLQGDLGSALVFVFMTAAMLLCAGLSLWYFLGASVTVVAAAPLLWRVLKPYQQARILAGFWPETDPQDKGFQALMSKNAISAGGFWGTGFSGGTEYQKVPFAHTDFIFAITGEKFGFFGALVVIVLLGTLVVRAMVVAYKMNGGFACYMCVGVAAVIIAQTLENIGMCLAKLPVVGITLPFMSYGGSSMISSFCLIGIVQSINAHRDKYFFERQKS